MFIQYIEMIESGSKLCILQHTKNLGEFVISLIIYAKKLSSQKYRYCKTYLENLPVINNTDTVRIYVY